MTGEQSFEERFGFRARGEFRCRVWYEIPLTILGLVMFVAGILAAIVVFSRIPGVDIITGAMAMAVIVPVWGLVCWWFVWTGQTGAAYSYDADEKEFRITDPKKHTETLYYSDIIRVDYKPVRFINLRIRGYKVTVTTKYRILTYDFLFSGDRSGISAENTPFYILERRAGLKQPPADGGASRTEA